MTRAYSQVLKIAFKIGFCSSSKLLIIVLNDIL